MSIGGGSEKLVVSNVRIVIIVQHMASVTVQLIVTARVYIMTTFQITFKKTPLYLGVTNIWLKKKLLDKRRIRIALLHV